MELSCHFIISIMVWCAKNSKLVHIYYRSEGKGGFDFFNIPWWRENEGGEPRSGMQYFGSAITGLICVFDCISHFLYQHCQIDSECLIRATVSYVNTNKYHFINNEEVRRMSLPTFYMLISSNRNYCMLVYWIRMYMNILH